MRPWLRHVFAIGAIFAVGACSSSSGCGMTPLPGGFDRSSTIQNAASVRLTKSGLAFIESNAGSLASNMVGSDTVTFPVPTDHMEKLGYDIDICPGGPDESSLRCIIEAKVSDTTVKLTAKAPHQLTIKGTVPVRLKDLPVDAEWYIGGKSHMHIILTNGGCSESPKSFATIPFSATISVAASKDTKHAARLGYTKMTVTDVQINQSSLNSSVEICGSGFIASLASFFKDTIVESATDGLAGTLKDSLNEQLCEKAKSDAPQFCPNGATPGKNDICFYDDGSCVSRMIGVDGHLDLGAAFHAFSPSTKGGIDILLAAGGDGARTDDPSAAWGDLNPVAGGATLGLFGGALPNPVSSCVTPVKLEIPTDIPQPDELLSNDLDGWQGEGPHVGFALSERFLNFALASAYNSGALCLGMGTAQFDMLTSGTFGMLVPSMKNLTLQKKKAPIAVVIRPKQPPTITVGDGTDMETDPLLRIDFKSLVLDFYVWSTDRYIRAFTLETDLGIPIGLDVSSAGLTPQFDKFLVSNAKVTNAPLVREDASKIAKSMSEMLEGLAGQLAGSMSAYDVSDALSSIGVKVKIEGSGIRKLEKGSDRFLGIFASLEVAPKTASLQTNTLAELVGKRSRRAGFSLTTATPENRPEVTIRVASDADYGSNLVEYSYRLDRGFWHRWTTDRQIVIHDPYLMVQGRHVVYVKSRLSGAPDTEDRTPAAVKVLLDVTPPRLTLTQSERGTMILDAWDHESADVGLAYRYANDDGSWSAWTSLPPGNETSISTEGVSDSVVVQVRDEEGNVATKRQGLIRGRPDGSLAGGASAGCGCGVLGSGRTSGHDGAWWLLALAAGVVIGRQRATGGRTRLS